MTRRARKRRIFALVLLALLCPLLALPARAELPTVSTDDEEITEEDIEKLIPPEYLSWFRDDNGRFSIPDLRRFFEIALKLLEGENGEGLRRVRGLCAVVILCGLLTLLEESFKGKRAAEILRVCMLLTGAAGTVLILKELIEMTAGHLSAIGAFLSGVLPVLTAAQTVMGGVTLSGVSALGFQMMLSLSSEITSGILLPLITLCCVFDLTAVISDNRGISGFAASVRKLTFFFLSGLCTLLVTVFSFQSVIAAKTDSVSLRAFRYTAGSLVPYVGSAISESAKTLLSGLELLRATVGGAAVTVLLFMLLPVLFRLLLYRFFFSFLNALSGAAGNDLLSSVFTGAGSCAGALAALTAVTDLTFIISFAVTVSVRIG